MPATLQSRSLPPPAAQIAIALGFVLGTWMLVQALQQLITGHALWVAGHPGPWAAWGAWGVLVGAAWMLVGNLYLFQNRMTNWKAMAILVVVCSWSAGWALVVLLAQLVLLLLPSTRHGLRG